METTDRISRLRAIIESLGSPNGPFGEFPCRFLGNLVEVTEIFDGWELTPNGEETSLALLIDAAAEESGSIAVHDPSPRSAPVGVTAIIEYHGSELVFFGVIPTPENSESVRFKVLF